MSDELREAMDALTLVERDCPTGFEKEIATIRHVLTLKAAASSPSAEGTEPDGFRWRWLDHNGKGDAGPWNPSGWQTEWHKDQERAGKIEGQFLYAARRSPFPAGTETPTAEEEVGQTRQSTISEPPFPVGTPAQEKVNG